MRRAIPVLITLLKHEDSEVLSSVVYLFSELSRKGE
jgi:hypothetical protein